MKIAMISVQENPLTALRAADAVGRRLHIAKLAEALHRQGHDLTVYTRRIDSCRPDRVRIDDGFEVVHVAAGPARTLDQDDMSPHIGEFARFLTERWASEAPDVIHAHHWTSGFAAVLGARRTGIPIVLSYHGLQGGDCTGIERLVGRKRRVCSRRPATKRTTWPGSGSAGTGSRSSRGASTPGCSR